MQVPGERACLEAGEKGSSSLGVSGHQPADGSVVVLLWVTEALGSLGMSDQQGSCAMEGPLHGCV